MPVLARCVGRAPSCARLALRGRSLGCAFTLRGGLGNPGGNALLDRGAFLDQICIVSLVLRYVGLGLVFSRFSLAHQLRHGALLSRSA